MPPVVAGTALIAAITPGVGTATQENSQCLISAEGSSVVADGTNYTLIVRTTMKPGFQGRRTVYAATQTITGGNSGWQAINSVNIPVP